MRVSTCLCSGVRCADGIARRTNSYGQDAGHLRRRRRRRNATLFVAPSGESVLIDTGNGGAAAPAMPIASWPR